MKALIVAICLWILKEVTGYEYRPEGGDQPPPPPEDLPDYITRWGDLSRYENQYAKNSLKSIYRVKSLKAPVFIPTPKESYPVTRPDGSSALKHVFGDRPKNNAGELIAPPVGAVLPGYYKIVPTTTKAYSKAYADGRTMIEICDPIGGACFPTDLEVIAYETQPGEWIILGDQLT
jgi:hypothetical protein